ncbi:MAG: nucleotide exchange factor GrpE [Blautia sp.]|nr:nucleotide exchange factor GrpE [Blautia sp.]
MADDNRNSEKGSPFSDEGIEIEITSGDEEDQKAAEASEEDAGKDIPEESSGKQAGGENAAPEGSSGECCSEEVPSGEEFSEEGSEETCEADAGEEACGGEAEETDPEAGEDGKQGDDPENMDEKKARKPSFFGKKKKENEKFQQQIEDLTDRLKRSMAEFDNFRKRTEKEKSSMYIIGARDIVEKILPVVDNFERGLAQAPEGDAFAEGMKLVYKQLMTALDDMGVKPIEAVGKEFDPSLHNAVMHVDDEEAGENIVVEEFQKGYTYKDFVVRHSMVKVAN